MATAGAEGAATEAAGMATALPPPPPPGLRLDLELGVLAVEVTEEDLVEGLAAAVAFWALEGFRGPGAFLLLWLSHQLRRVVTRATEPG